jgi:hypothetical protein
VSLGLIVAALSTQAGLRAGLVTGGELVDGTRSANRDLSGSSIRGGIERLIKTGDVVFIPAGLSHGVKDTKGITWLNIRFDTKE